MTYEVDHPGFGLRIVTRVEGNVTWLRRVPVELTHEQLTTTIDQLTYWKFPQELKDLFGLNEQLFWQHEVSEKVGLGKHELFSASTKSEHNLNEAPVVLDFHIGGGETPATSICISGVVEDSQKTPRVLSLSYLGYSGKLQAVGVVLPTSEIKYPQTFSNFILTPNTHFPYEHGGGTITKAMIKEAYGNKHTLALIRAYDLTAGGNYLSIEKYALTSYEPIHSGLSVFNGEKRKIFMHEFNNYSISAPSNLTQ